MIGSCATVNFPGTETRRSLVYGKEYPPPPPIRFNVPLAAYTLYRPVCPIGKVTTPVSWANTIPETNSLAPKLPREPVSGFPGINPFGTNQPEHGT
jgi:hypothetical protein